MKNKSCMTCKYVSNIFICRKTGGMCWAYCDLAMIEITDPEPCSYYQRIGNENE